MKIAMVVESMFGNTQTLADAVARGLHERGAEVTFLSLDVDGWGAVGDVDLLVLGAPTHALGLSRPSTRADAVTRGADEARAARGLREWVETLGAAPADGSGPPVAVFDSKALSARHWPGSASRGLSRRLRKQGCTVLDRTSFYVEGVTGPIAPGETSRARDWGQWLASAVRRPGPPARI